MRLFKEFKNLPTLEEMNDFHELFNVHIANHNRPYTWISSISSFDGVISMHEPSDMGPDSIAFGNYNTLMKNIDFELLKHSWGQADAVLISAEILRKEPRLQGCIDERSGKKTLQIIVTNSGEINPLHPIFQHECIIACPKDTARNIPEELREKVVVFETVSFFPKLFTYLKHEKDVLYLDVSAGGAVVGQILEDKLADEWRHSLSGQIVGVLNSHGEERPKIVSKDRSWIAETCPKLEFMSIRMTKHLIFSRSKILY